MPKDLHVKVEVDTKVRFQHPAGTQIGGVNVGGRFTSIPEAIQEALYEVAEEGAAIAIANVPHSSLGSSRYNPDREPGRLEEAIGAERTRRGAMIRVDETVAPHARAIEFGTPGNHIIPGPSSFIGTKGPRFGPMRAININHPGNQEYRYLRDAKDAIAATMMATIRAHLG